MTTHNLALAKASLAAGLLRSGPQPVSREELKLFHESLDATLATCSANDIQRCKEWLLKNQVTSTARSDLLGKYLVALSSNVQNQDTKRAGSKRRQHLAILYLFNDLLHHLRYHGTDQSVYKGLADGLSRYVPDCVSYAVAFDEKSFPRHKRRIARLMAEWSRNHYFSTSLQQELERIAAENAAVENVAKASGPTDSVKQEDPFIMPAVHGDPSVPYHELPAANLMPHIIPNTPVPIDPHHVRALQFRQGPAEPALVEVLKTFLKDIDMLYGTAIFEEEGISIELDDLGQKIVRDKQSGIVLSTETYYGWSREFCENMKRKRNGLQDSRDNDSDDSRDRSISPRKRTRYGSRDASPGRQRSRRRSYSRSTATSRSRSRSRSRSKSRSGLRPPGRQGHDPRPPRSRSRSFPRSRSRSRSRSPPRPAQQPQRRPFQQQSYPEPLARHPNTTVPPHQQEPFKTQHPLPPPVQAAPMNQQVYLPPQPQAQPQSQNHPLPLPPPQRMASSNHFYNPGIVPPRPANWQGPWPPPPPIPALVPVPGLGPGPGPGHAMHPHPQYQTQYQAQQYPYTTPAPAGVWPGMPIPPPQLAAPLPPPPPPPQQGQNYQGYGHGYNGYNASYAPNNGGRGGRGW